MAAYVAAKNHNHDLDFAGNWINVWRATGDAMLTGEITKLRAKAATGPIVRRDGVLITPAEDPFVAQMAADDKTKLDRELRGCLRTILRLLGEHDPGLAERVKAV